ncbi:MAG: CPBP family intramembrane glutamic endopeptidase [Gaiellaceae bacterium]
MNATSQRETTRLGIWSALALLIVVAGYTGRSGGRPPADALYRYETAIAGAVLYLALAAVVAFMARGPDVRRFLALRRPPSWPRALGLAAATYAAIMVGVYALLSALGGAGEQGLTPESWDSGRAAQYAANAVVVALIGPVVEELLYRGAGLSIFRRFGSLTAVVVTALPFALGHGLVRAMPALLLFGILIALLRLRTRSIYPPILVHAAFNATALLAAVAV